MPLHNIAWIPPLCWEGWTSYQIFKKGRKGLTGSQVLEGVTWVNVFREAQFLLSKLKAETLMTKKVYKQKCFSVITRNLNLEF